MGGLSEYKLSSNEITKKKTVNVTYSKRYSFSCDVSVRTWDHLFKKKHFCRLSGRFV